MRRSGVLHPLRGCFRFPREPGVRFATPGYPIESLRDRGGKPKGLLRNRSRSRAGPQRRNAGPTPHREESPGARPTALAPRVGIGIGIGIGIENEEVGEEPGSIPIPIAIPIPIPGPLFALRKWRLPKATRTAPPRSGEALGRATRTSPLNAVECRKMTRAKTRRRRGNGPLNHRYRVTKR